MTLLVGDRVCCIRPFHGHPEVGSLGTVVYGGDSPCVEFDVPFLKGHTGNREGVPRGREGHCWNFWNGDTDYLEVVVINATALSPEERTRKAVLKKIKYLEQKFEQRQKEKKNASTLASVQTGVYVSQSHIHSIRRFTATYDSGISTPSW